MLSRSFIIWDEGFEIRAFSYIHTSFTELEIVIKKLNYFRDEIDLMLKALDQLKGRADENPFAWLKSLIAIYREYPAADGDRETRIAATFSGSISNSINSISRSRNRPIESMPVAYVQKAKSGNSFPIFKGDRTS